MGPAVIIAVLIGVWKKPKPTPQRGSRHTTSHFAGVVGKKTIRSKPAANNAKPMPVIPCVSQRAVNDGRFREVHHLRDWC
jgi:hypothetical protein